ncbi:MAG: hypothetical protein EBT90_05870 [Rhodobacteraceae bacterium]|nr:hypothetical protein [Paracoccaceae bacterium]
MIHKFLTTVAASTMMTGMAMADYSLTILHTNDFHARFEPISKYDSGCSSEDNAEGKCFGGSARLVSAVAAARARSNNSILVDGGDQFQGTLFYTYYKGKLAAEMMNKLGYDGMTVGNHEFDDGPEVLRGFMDAVNFPVLMSNADFSGEALLHGKLQKSAIIERGGLEEIRNRVVAETAQEIIGTKDECRARECAMGNLIADAMLDRVRDQGIEIAIQNGGGIRASIDAGPVTMGEVLTVLPFQNTLSTFFVTGQTIVDALENGVSQMEEGAGRFPQVAGMSYTVDPTAAAGGRISDVMVGGAPIDLAKSYGVVSNNYVRNGGDGFKMFRDAENVYDFGPDLADVTAEYMAKIGPVTPYKDGRITVK